MVLYPIKLFDDLNLKLSKPFEVTTDCDRSLNSRSNKIDLKLNDSDLMTLSLLLSESETKSQKSHFRVRIRFEGVIDNSFYQKPDSKVALTKLVLKPISPVFCEENLEFV